MYKTGKNRQEYIKKKAKINCYEIIKITCGVWIGKGEYLMKNIERKEQKIKRKKSGIDGQFFYMLKDSASNGESKVIQEAEKVVEKYMDRKPERKGNENKKKSLWWWMCAMSFGLGMLATRLFV